MIVKLSRTAILVLSAVAILSTGCATIPTHTSSPAEDDSSALTADKSSASNVPPIVRELSKLTWEVGPEVYYFEYEEQSIMNESGMFYGLNVAATVRPWIPTSEQSWEALNLTTFKWMARGEARFALGQVDYDGGIGGTPYETGNLDDRAFETRLLIGPDFLTENTIFTLFTGIGYRYLHDELMANADPYSGYERESQYLYLPLGAEMTTQLGGGWSWGLSGEFDILLWGNQRSHIPWWYIFIITNEAGDEILDVWFISEEFSDNFQPRGYGLRASGRLQKKGDKIDFIIEPFIRYWKISESDLDYYQQGWEPTNSTLEAGIRVMLGFH